MTATAQMNDGWTIDMDDQGLYWNFSPRSARCDLDVGRLDGGEIKVRFDRVSGAQGAPETLEREPFSRKRTDVVAFARTSVIR